MPSRRLTPARHVCVGVFAYVCLRTCLCTCVHVDYPLPFSHIGLFFVKGNVTSCLNPVSLLRTYSMITSKKNYIISTFEIIC